MTLGKRIKAARERLRPKMTQAHLGAFFKISDKAVSSWERDETIPEFDKLGEIARRLRIPADWLLEGRGPPPDPSESQPKNILDQLNPAERAVVESVAQTLLQQRSGAA